MGFQFVENGNTDPATRKLIRSHVMKGKNVGKTRLRAKQEGGRVSLCDEVHYSKFSISISDKIAGYSPLTRVEISPTIGHSFSTLTFPCEAQPYMRDLIQQFVSIANQGVYPLDFCRPVDTKNQLLFRFIQTDEAFFHSVLAMSEVSQDVMLGRQETSPRALQHLSNTYRCIAQNLQRHGAPSEQTIAAVMSMALHEDFRGHPVRSKVHIDALERMVELRGGISQFGTNSMLQQKICRADIEFALHAGSYPRLNRDEFPREMIELKSRLTAPPIAALNLGEIDQDIHCLLRGVNDDMANFSALLNDDHTCFKFEPFAYQEIIISVCYRLLHHRPLASTRPENNNENALYLGLLAVMSTMLFQRGRALRLPYDLLAEKLRNAIEDAPSNGSIEERTLLWLLFIGGVSVFESTDRSWLLPRIKRCLSKLRIDSWPTALDTIRRRPWIDAIHAKQGQQLWQAVLWD